MVNHGDEAADLAMTGTQACRVGIGWGYIAMTASKDGAQSLIIAVWGGVGFIMVLCGDLRARGLVG